jgi:hypothetical protein
MKILIAELLSLLLPEATGANVEGAMVRDRVSLTGITCEMATSPVHFIEAGSSW